MKKNYTFLLVLSLTAVSYLNQVQAQNIYTFAGNGTGMAGYSGDGGYASSALLNIPSGVATHDYSNVFIADQANHVIRKVNYQGIINTYAGDGSMGYSGDGGAADSCRLNDPYAIALDASGNLVIADYVANVVRRVNVASGIITTIAGTGTPGYAGDGGPATIASLNYPYGVAVDASGNIFIADAGNNVIREVTASGLIQTVAGTGYGHGAGLGTGAYSGDGGPAYDATLNFPTAVAVDVFGNLFIADAGNNVIRKVAVSDTITTYAGNGYTGYSGDGGSAKAARLNFASAVAVDGSGNLYIADQGNNAIRKVDTAGMISTVAGNGTAGYSGDGSPATAALISAPKGVAVDGSGLIYIADAGNNAVRIVGNYSPSAVNKVNNPAPANIKICPNPSTGSFSIVVPQSAVDGTVTVTDMFGRDVVTKAIGSSPSQGSTVTINNMLPGNYIVKVASGQNIYRETVAVW